jgi:hypothetical protein
MFKNIGFASLPSKHPSIDCNRPAKKSINKKISKWELASPGMRNGGLPRQ